MNPAQKNMRAQAGFTLVELAIVMIIIGLLIAGVLKGQALIGNAKVTAQVAQIKSIDAATSTFRDMYNALPGDIANPAGRLANCTAVGNCNVAGGGDGQVGLVAGGAQTFGAPAGEQLTFFIHLNAAQLLTGINPAAAVLASWGGAYPAAKVNGGLLAGSVAGGAGGGALSNMQGMAAANVLSGLYLSLNNNPAAASDAVGSITANEAARLDTKIDDGTPISGSVFPGGAAACIVGNLYNESVAGNNCNLFVRIQG
jgi:prepilin-type N-terminal cleavage/methylation domain-containing protein